ncbi:MAG: RES domain-containing protein [Deltaproteobacteria bacterium]|nr:MAG: RES domain-containing protein [Deltaproteobacteria bacterium]
MSPSIWTRCAGPSRARALKGSFSRVVEAQFRNSTRKLVDSDEEQRLLEELLDARAKLPVPAGFEGLHYLLYTPFRHPPLRNGSRFGTRGQRGILYGAHELPAALAEVAYYRLVFLEGTRADLGTVFTELTAFEFGIAVRRGIDLSRPPFRSHEAEISSPVRYDASQLLGAEMRAAGVEACLYVSARARPRALNLAVFENVFNPSRPTAEERWSCRAARARVEFRSEQLVKDERRHSFSREQFEVAGKLPTPALS